MQLFSAHPRILCLESPRGLGYRLSRTFWDLIVILSGVSYARSIIWQPPGEASGSGSAKAVCWNDPNLLVIAATPKGGGYVYDLNTFWALLLHQLVF